MKSVVDPDMCIGCELCVDTAPEVFSMNDDGVAVAVESALDASLEADATQAEEECPADAISHS